jgi:hypothetical protein
MRRQKLQSLYFSPSIITGMIIRPTIPRPTRMTGHVERRVR